MNEIQAEKLDRFVNSVNNEVDEKINKIISEAEIQKSHQVKKTEDEELLNAYNKIQRSVRDIESKYRRMLALKQQQLKTDSLMQRENLAQKIFDAVSKLICEFTVSEKYENYLLKTIKINNRYYSYRNLISREVHLLSNYIANESNDYKPYIMKW